MEVLEESIFPEKPPVVYASFGKRFAALLIDIIMVIILHIILIFPLTILKHSLLNDSATTNNLLNTIISWLYFALQESSKNMATIGKIAMKIDVTDMDGNRISFGRATGRYFAKIISTLILFVGYFMMLWDERHQTLHDKIADTFVVRND